MDEEGPGASGFVAGFAMTDLDLGGCVIEGGGIDALELYRALEEAGRRVAMISMLRRQVKQMACQCLILKRDSHVMAISIVICARDYFTCSYMN